MRVPVSSGCAVTASLCTRRLSSSLTPHTSLPSTNPLSPLPSSAQIVWVSGLFDLNRQDLTEFKRPLTEYYDRFNRILDRGA